MFVGFVSRVPFDSAKPPTFVVYNSHVLVRRSFTTENKMIDSCECLCKNVRSFNKEIVSEIMDHTVLF